MRATIAAAAIVAIASAELADLDLEFFGQEATGQDYYGHDLPNINVDHFEEKTFVNLVDHWNAQDDRTYEQRWWVNDDYWTGDGPLFLYICGEYRCSVPDTRLYPFMLGATYGARLLVLEHRFYGDSQPFDDWSLDSLRYLSSQQALADLAYFLGAINEKDNEVLVIGGSYPGAMSAWFRERYPHIAIGAWSSSGVVQPIVDFWHFDEQVFASTAKSGEWCPRMIQESMKYVTEQGRRRDSGQADNVITKTLAAGPTPDMRTDDWMFFYADVFVEGVQYGGRTALCETLKGLEGSSNDDIVEAMVAYGAAEGVSPPDYDSAVIADTTVDVHSSARPWTYQYCTEYGWFQTPSKAHPMRSEDLALDYWPAMCERGFEGLKFGKESHRPRAWATTVDQGGVSIAEDAIFFANGGEDPWRWATQQESKPWLGQVSVLSDCDDCGHCAELYTPKPGDPKELQETRREVADWIARLLGPKPHPHETAFLH